MPDLWQFIDDIDADKQAMAIKRLEDRAQMPKFVAIRENYFDRIGLPVTGRITSALVAVPARYAVRLHHNHRVFAGRSLGPICQLA